MRVFPVVLSRWSFMLLLALAAGQASAQNLPIDDLIAGLSSGNALTRAQAARDIGALGPKAERAVPALLILLGDETFLQWRRAAAPFAVNVADTSPGEEASAALASIGAAAIEPLLGVTGDTRSAVRRNAAYALFRLVGRSVQSSPAIDQRVKDVMLGLLDDADPVVRNTAAACERSVRDARAYDTLRRLATSAAENGQVRTSALWALSASGNPLATEVIISLLADPDPTVQLAAVSIIFEAKVVDRRVIDALLRMLGRPNPDCCALHLRATQVLGRAGDRRAVEPMLRVLEQLGPEIRARGRMSSTQLETSDALNAALAKLTGDPAGVPACMGSMLVADCMEHRAAYWRAWWNARQGKGLPDNTPAGCQEFSAACTTTRPPTGERILFQTP